MWLIVTQTVRQYRADPWAEPGKSRSLPPRLAGLVFSLSGSECAAGWVGGKARCGSHPCNLVKK